MTFIDPEKRAKIYMTWIFKMNESISLKD